MMLGCMHALLLARASTQPTNNKGSTIHLQWAELKGATNHHELLELIGRKQPANAELLRKAGAALRAASPAAPPVAVEPAVGPAASLPLALSAWLARSRTLRCRAAIRAHVAPARSGCSCAPTAARQCGSGYSIAWSDV